MASLHQHQDFWKNQKGIIAFLCNILIAYLLYAVCKVAFVLENFDISLLADTDFIKGCLLFDTSAIFYTLSPYALMILFPLHWKERKGFHSFARWYYVIINSLCIIANLADVVYFQYTGRRTTLSVFRQFSAEHNIPGIIAIEALNHWYLVLLAIILILATIRLYRKTLNSQLSTLNYYITHTVAFLIFAPLCIIGMRGGTSAASKPVTILHAHQYVSHPSQAAAVINTPFAILRTISKKPFVNPHYFSDEEALRIFNPVTRFNSGNTKSRKNIVILILESFGKEYIGAYNDYEGYTPFLDSLIEHSLTYSRSYSNARVSMEGLPAILSSIPMFEESFFLTDAALQGMSGIAGLLRDEGYQTAFFHGADNSSMGIHAFTKATGFSRYYGRDEFGKDDRFRGDEEFDGKWAIWDEPFLQFSALHIDELRQPFVAGIFTATSHHPYALPTIYNKVYKEEGLPIHKCVRYTDNALRQFFMMAREMDWYSGTLFVITADHTNQSEVERYQTDTGRYEVPIIFFDPSGELPIGMSNTIAQQTDIMPSLLSYLGYDKPFTTFGKDLRIATVPDASPSGTVPDASPSGTSWAINYTNGVYQYITDSLLIQFNGSCAVSSSSPSKGRLGGVTFLKAVIQAYMNFFSPTPPSSGASACESRATTQDEP